MFTKEAGILEAAKVPARLEEKDNTITNLDSSTKYAACKPFDTTIFTRHDREGITAQLQAYLDLGLTPIPLRGKIPTTLMGRFS